MTTPNEKATCPRCGQTYDGEGEYTCGTCGSEYLCYHCIAGKGVMCFQCEYGEEI